MTEHVTYTTGAGGSTKVKTELDFLRELEQDVQGLQKSLGYENSILAPLRSKLNLRIVELLEAQDATKD